MRSKERGGGVGEGGGGGGWMATEKVGGEIEEELSDR